MPYLIDIIQFICTITLFIVAIIEFIGIRKKELEIKDLMSDITALNSELDTLKFNISTQEMKLTEEMLKINAELIPIINKIQKNYAIAKIDKLKLLNFLIVLMRDTDYNLLLKVNVAKKYTYKSASEILLQYIKKPMFTDKEISEVVNAVYWMITK